MKMKGLAAFLVVCAVCLLVPAPSPAAVNVTAKIKVPLQSSGFDKTTATTTNTYFLKNSSRATFTGPFRVVIESLNNRDVALVNPDGYTRAGKPYYEYTEASLGRYAKSAGKPWIFEHRCGKKVSATVKPFTSSWQIAFQPTCSPLVTVYVSVFSSEGGANHTPVAEAGADQTVKVRSVIPLNGSLSTDEDGDPLTYKWTVVSKPAWSRVTLTGATSVRPTAKFTMGGTYVLGLTVSDGALTSARDTCVLSTSNSRPVAEAGPDQTVELGLVRLDGGGSTDADGNKLTYAWTIVSMPPGSTVALTNATAVRPSFMADLPGDYVVQLVVSHGTKKSYPAFCRISTVNSLPRANAGADQKIAQGDTVRLDGAGSSDVDGDQLAYRWALLAKPAGSTATLAEPGSVRPTITADVAGTYVAQLTVNDGHRDSVPDTVIFTAENVRPVADAGRDRTAGVGATVTLDGNRSRDEDGSVLTWKWAFLSVPKGSLARLLAGTTVGPSFQVDRDGTYVVQLTVSDGVLKGLLDTVVIDTGNSRPAADAGADQEVYTNRTVHLDGSGSADPDVDFLTPFWAMLLRPEGSAAVLSDPTALAPDFLADLPGTYVLQLIVRDDTFMSEPDTVAISATVRMVTVPNVVGLVQADAESAIIAADLTVGTVTTVVDDVAPAGSVISQDPAGGTSIAEGTAVALVVSSGPPPIPPDPGSVAPPLDPTVTTTMVAATEFLYTGPDPIQRGVALGTIEARRVAVIRGKVSTREGLPLSGVSITILDHPEFGRTLSRLDGMFDLAVNGGGHLTVQYRKGGFLEVQRKFEVPWLDYVWAPDVVLIPLDGHASSVDLTSSAPFQVARGPVVADGRGTRQSTLLFPEGTQAEIVLPDGTTQPISNLTVRVTEYTVGDRGPDAMPGDLPLGIGYTYAQELSVDEALAARASEVHFSTPVVNYLENFLGFDVGVTVPGYYFDRKRGLWIPMPNGQVIKLLGVSGGLADLDVDGDDSADTGSSLVDLGITEAERQQLAGLYAAGQTLWRARLLHFTPIDYNWPRYVEDPYQTDREIEPDRNNDDPCNEPGASVIECQNQTLGETLTVTGTPFTLNYRSGRVPGRIIAGTLDIPLTGSSLSYRDYFLGTELRIGVAGRRFSSSYPPATDQSVTFTWDGIDSYGRRVQGAQPVRVSVGYRFVSRRCVAPGRCIWQPGAEDTYWRNWWGTLGHWNHGRDLGEWTLSVHHGFDTATQTLYLGTGEQRSATNQARVVDTVAGNGHWCESQAESCGDGGKAIDAQIVPWGVDVGPDGSLYITDRDSFRIWRAKPDGNIAHVAGLRAAHYWCDNATDPCGDGGPATEARFGDIYSSAVGQDGSIYIADEGSNRIRKVGPDGIITTVAGTGEAGFAGDGGPATQAKLNQPYSVKAAPDGNLYIADLDNARIRRVGPDGIITTVAGNGGYCNPTTDPCGDGGPATEAPISGTLDLAIGPDGSIYFGFGYRSRIRKVSPDGAITTFAGTGTGTYGGDGGPAEDAEIKVLGLAFAPDGSLLFSNGENAIRRIDPNGVITTVAGNQGRYGYGGDNGPATLAKFNRPWYLAVGPNGHIYVADAGNWRVRRVRPLMPGYLDADIVITSEDGGEVYIFDRRGRHLRTLNALTGAVQHEFAYDAEGRLVRITDGDGNVTTIERDGSGNPTGIVGPDGQHTALILDPNGFLAGVTNPAGETNSFEYTAAGLMTKRISPRGPSSTFTHDSVGRLLRDEDAAGGFQALVRTEVENGYEVTRTTAMGEATTYRVENLPTGDKRSVYDSDCCGMNEVLESTNGMLTSTAADGTVAEMRLGPDPRFGMESPLIASSTTRTPGGLARETTMSRAVTLGDSLDPLSLVSMTDTMTVNNRAYASLYDAATRTRTSTSPAGRQTVAVTDTQGRPTSVGVTGLDPVGFAYDSHGRLASITTGNAGAARTFTLGYDWEGNLASITDPLARVTGFEHDAAGRVLRKNLPDGRTVHFTYDAAGNLTSVTPPGRPAHAFGFNALGMLSQYAPPALDAGGWSTTYAYDLDRRLTAINRPDGEVVSLSYSPEGRLETLSTSDYDYSYTYDPTSKFVAGINAPGGEALAFTYDGNLLLSEAWAGDVAGRIDRTFDNDFRIISRRVNGADPVALGYDPDGLLIQSGSLAIARSAKNQLITGATLGSVGDTRDYNSFGETVSYTAAYGATELLLFSYVRDKLGRITEKTETMDGVTNVFSYAYDLAGRLTAVTKDGVPHESYAYDSNGNRLSGTTEAGSKSGTYDDQDRLLEYGSATYAYSANGDLVAKTVSGQTTAYDYNSLGNLRGVTLPGGTQITYVIDGLNRRVGKKVDGTLVQGFLYDNMLHPVAELDASGNVVSRFVYGTRDNAPDYMTRGGTTYRIISDHLGSPRLVVDVSTGSIVQRITYDSFGNVLSDSNPGFQPFGFAGGLYDRDTKLTRFGARDYDAGTGRWTAKDPILFAGGGANLYGYVLNDPMNLIDITGTLAPATWPGPSPSTGNKILDIAVKAVTEYVKAQQELAEDLEGEIARVREMRKEAERIRKQLERLLEELRRMFPCHKRGSR